MNNNVRIRIYRMNRIIKIVASAGSEGFNWSETHTNQKGICCMQVKGTVL